MAYAQGDKIRDTEFDGFVASVNQIVGTGSGSQGYGQPDIALVNPGNKIQAQGQWTNLVQNVVKAASHQGISITGMTVPSYGDKISFINALSTNITAISGLNRLNAAAQGTLTSVNSYNGLYNWSNYLYFYFTVAFSSADALRWFFNAGGQIGINSSHPAGGSFINSIIAQVCADMGTVWVSSVTPSLGTSSITLSGTTYQGVTKIGGANPENFSINSSLGYYALPTDYVTLFTQRYGSGIYINTYTSAVASVVNNEFRLAFVIDEAPNGALVSIGTTASLLIRFPSQTYLLPTWGQPTVTTAISPSN